jgi:hypothetical protein
MMSETFDPYYKWLGIPPKDQPPNHYRLLGLELFEPDLDVIDSAAEQRMAHVRSVQAGKHAKDSQRLLNEIAAAKVCLLRSEKKNAYDNLLRQRLNAAAAKSSPQASGGKRSLPVAAAAPAPLRVAQPLSASQPAPAANDPFDFASGSVQSTTRRSTSARNNRTTLLVAGITAVGIAGACIVVFAFYNADRSSPNDVPVKVAGNLTEPTKSPASPSPAAAPARPKPSVAPPAVGKVSEANATSTSSRTVVPASDESARSSEDLHSSVPTLSRQTDGPGTGTAVDSTGSNPLSVSPKPDTAEPAISQPALDNREAIPDDAALANAAKLIKQVYKDDFAKAKTSAQKETLAKSLLEKAMITQTDRVSQFALLQTARDMAAHGGDFGTAVLAIDELNTIFQIDGPNIKAAVLLKGAPSATSRFQRRLLAQKAAEAAEEAFAKDDFTNAKKLALLVQGEAKAGGDNRLVKWAAARLTSIDAANQAIGPVNQAQSTLMKTPADPDANLIVGKYLCLVKGNWQAGLPKLALGGDPDLKRMAANELAIAVTPDDQRKLGDGWWNVADTLGGTEKKEIQARAAFWYKQAMPGLTGLDKDKIEKKIAGSADLHAKLTMSAYVFACSDDQSTLYLNGKPLLRANGSEGGWTDCELEIGDTILVKLINTGGPYGFGCLIKLDDGSIIKTTLNSAWVAYTPKDEARWFDPLTIGPIDRITSGNSNFLPNPAAHVESFLSRSDEIWGKGDICYLMYVIQ